jgi:hypothetical protein
MNFFQVLTLIFIILKLTNAIAWGWFWVLCPMIPSILFYGVILILFIMGLCFGGKIEITGRQKRKTND